MAKDKIRYICNSCGYEAARWLGKCPHCGNWNTFEEDVVKKSKNIRKNDAIPKAVVTKLSEIKSEENERIKTNINEFDRVLGNGLVPGSIVLIGGDPGIGKSTLVMQASSSITKKVLYVTGEESLNQINLRAKRMKINADSFYVLAETDLDIILNAIEETKPDVVIIDSIQTMYKPALENAPGTITQIRETTADLQQHAKSKNFTVIIIGHVTKEGMIAGPKILEHIVDTVIQFEGERNHSYRILRAQKNRFGSTNEIGIFEMQDTGLREVLNPSEVFLSERKDNTSGNIVTASIEGTRPVLLEVQALVTPNNFGNPQRVATGFDYRRLSILLAVIEKRSNLRVSANNVFLNMAGGIRITEPAVDLAVCCAIASSILEKPIEEGYVALGEVGLGGEIRSVGFLEKRIQEAAKLGFENIIIPRSGMKKLKGKSEINLIAAENLKEVYRIIF